jgi:alpha-beta hydrolase superfamily lysophospholipase
MFRIAHSMMVWIYALAPVLAMAYALASARRQRAGAAADIVFTVIVGTLLGVVATTIYAMIVDGRAGFDQFALAAYFTIGVLLLLRALDAVVRGILRLAFGKSQRGFLKVTLSALARALVLLFIGLPYVMAAAMTFRPRIMPHDDPQKLLRFPFNNVQFESSDGVKLSAWWIPALRRGLRPNAVLPGDFGAKTVILCHGLAANRSTQLSLVRWLVPAGYNALAFDFRAHGESGGQFTSIGDRERLDVLAAVHWLRMAHPEQARRIVGIGVNMGAAALLAAATDPSADGQAIEAIAVYGAYGDASTLADDFTSRALVPPLDRWTARFGLLMASIHGGANLADFSPAKMAWQLWPRPILVIHATGDRIVPFEQGRDLFNAASFPKTSIWLPRKDQIDAIRDDEAADAVRVFFEVTPPGPTI